MLSFIQRATRGQIIKQLSWWINECVCGVMFWDPEVLLKINTVARNNLRLVYDRWTIRARVTNKSTIRTWSNSRGDGKLFSMELVDESVSIWSHWLFSCHVNKVQDFQVSAKPDLLLILTKFYVYLQGEIRVTGFNQEVDKFYSLVEVGKVRCSSK